MLVTVVVVVELTFPPATLLLLLLLLEPALFDERESEGLKLGPTVGLECDESREERAGLPLLLLDG